MNAIPTCPSCGETLAPDAPEGLCPRCLLRGAVEPGTEPTLDKGGAIDAPAVGTCLRYFGDYELVEEIARGGMGVVFRARQRSLDRTVAVKMILAGHLAGTDDIERFRSEAEAAARLQHPGIVAIHEVGDHDGLHYFSMDFVEGESLAERVAEGPASPLQAAVWVRAMAEAIDHAHQHGVVHRDLKPSNVLLDHSGRPRITDFGLAKRLGGERDLTLTGSLLGTAAYMSPEQAAGRTRDVGPASDIYSLGAILYELLVGEPPFLAETLEGTLARVVSDEPTSPRQRRPQVPKDLDTICQACLEKSPTKRYASAADLAEDLRRFLDREAILARPIGPLRRMGHWALRHPWKITASASLVIVLLLALVYGLWSQNRYLSWTDAHPEYVKEPGARTERARRADDIGGLVWPLALCAITFYRRYGKGLEWRRAFQYSAVGEGDGASVPRHWLLLVSTMGLLSVGYGGYVLIASLASWAWEGASQLVGSWATVFLCVWVGGIACWQAAVDVARQQLAWEETPAPPIRGPSVTRSAALLAGGSLGLVFALVFAPPAARLGIGLVAGLTALWFASAGLLLLVAPRWLAVVLSVAALTAGIVGGGNLTRDLERNWLYLCILLGFLMGFSVLDYCHGLRNVRERAARS